jgi:hypothetical protein
MFNIMIEHSGSYRGLLHLKNILNIIEIAKFENLIHPFLT